MVGLIWVKYTSTLPTHGTSAYYWWTTRGRRRTRRGGGDEEEYSVSGLPVADDARLERELFNLKK